MSTRDKLHRLVDELPESELAAAERRAMHEAREELARGKVRTLAEVRRAWGR